MENQSNLEKVRQALAQVALVEELAGGTVFNGQEGKYVEKTYAFVAPQSTAEISYADFRQGLLGGVEGIHDWDRENGRLFSHETSGNISKVIEIQMVADVETMVSAHQEMQKRLQG